jgi:hypothetical protein
MATERNPNSVPVLIAKSNAGDNADVIIWGDPATHRLLVNASVTVGAVSGSKTNNNAAPGSDNIGAFVGVATASAPSYTEGNLVALSTDLAGALRVTGSLSIGGTTDNSAYTAGSSSGTPSFGFYHATIDTVTDGRAASIAITSKRAQHVALHDVAGNALLGQKTTANSIPVALASDATLPVTNAGTFVVQATLAAETTKVIGTINIAAAQTIATVTAVTGITNALPAGTNLLGKVGIDQTTPGTTNAVSLAQIGANTTLTGNGVTGTGSLRVTIASDNTAFTVNAAQSGTWNIGTVTTVSTVTAVTTVSTVTNLAQMNGAALLMGNGVTGTGAQRVTLSSDNTGIANWGHGAIGAAVPAGATYKGLIAKTANPSAATDGNMVGALADKLGKQVVVGSIRDLKVVQKTTITASTSETTIGTAVASTFLDLYGLIIANSSATVCSVTIKDATAGTTRAIFTVPAGDTRGFMLPESGGLVQATVNNNWTATCSASVSSIEITALFVKNI